MSAEFILPLAYQVLQRGEKIAFKVTSCPASAGRLTVRNLNGQNVYTGDMLRDESGALCGEPICLPAAAGYSAEFAADGEHITVAPFGVGEVIIVAGQSNATNSHNRQFNSRFRDGSVTVFDHFTGKWRIADDRQPCFDMSDYNARFGSLWALTGDAVRERLGVPVGFVNCAFGATASFQWLPGADEVFGYRLFDCLVRGCRTAGAFRYILWQQGESDVMWRTTREVYMERVRAVKAELDRQLGHETVWLLAKSTIHPSVYVDPENEKVIYDALEELCDGKGFLRGPDTDTLGGGEYRDLSGLSGHMTEAGQLAASAMWADNICGYIG